MYGIYSLNNSGHHFPFTREIVEFDVSIGFSLTHHFYTKDGRISLDKLNKTGFFCHFKQTQFVLRRTCEERFTVAICYLCYVMAEADDSKKVKKNLLIALISIV